MGFEYRLKSLHLLERIVRNDKSELIDLRLQKKTTPIICKNENTDSDQLPEAQDLS